MAKATLLDQPTDYKRLGINPERIEVWEDRRRNTDSSPNNWEWWYSDFIFDDGTTAVIQFFTKGGNHIRKNGDFPSINLRITHPDGTHYSDSIEVKARDCSFGNDKCDVRLGVHLFTGDLREYHIHVEPTKGYGADLKLVSCSKPYRPGTAYFNFGSPDKFYTWFCAVPKAEVSGTITFGGKTCEVIGKGYHDHQWGNVQFLTEWNNWLWARQSFDDYSMIVFDMVSTAKTGFSRFPIVFVQDKDGNIVFENTENVSCEVLESYCDDKASGKEYPKSLRYVFENSGDKVIYTLKEKKVIESQGLRTISFVRKLAVKAMGLNPSYSRYLADGAMSLMTGGKTVNRSGELIYEFMFPGDSFAGHLETEGK